MRWCWPITVGIDVVRRIVVGREEIFVGFVAALHPRYVSAVAPVAAQVRRACSGRRVRFIVFVDNATAEAGGQYARAHGDVLLRVGGDSLECCCSDGCWPSAVAGL